MASIPYELITQVGLTASRSSGKPSPDNEPFSLVLEGPVTTNSVAPSPAPTRPAESRTTSEGGPDDSAAARRSRSDNSATATAEPSTAQHAADERTTKVNEENS